MPGDVLGASRAGSVNVRLAEQSAAAEPRTNFAVRLAMLETARVAQMRLRFSRRLRRAVLARGRVVPPVRTLAAGDLAFFYRKRMKMRKDDSKKGRKTKLVLNKWRGPGMVLGHEGNNAIYIAYRGGVTKCAPEHVRAASHTEQLMATEWAEHLADAVKDLHSGDVTFPQSDVRAGGIGWRRASGARARSWRRGCGPRV